MGQLDVSISRFAMPHCQRMVVVLTEHCAHLQQGSCRVWVHHLTLAFFVVEGGWTCSIWKFTICLGLADSKNCTFQQVESLFAFWQVSRSRIAHFIFLQVLVC